MVRVCVKKAIHNCKHFYLLLNSPLNCASEFLPGVYGNVLGGKIASEQAAINWGSYNPFF